MKEMARSPLVKNPTICKNTFHSPSDFPWSKRCCGCNCALCTLEEFEKTFFKSFSCYLTIINCKGQHRPKLLRWWGNKEASWESSGTTSGLSSALKMSGSFLWFLAETIMVLGEGKSRNLCLNNIMNKVSPEFQGVNGYDGWHHISLV